MNQWQQPVDGIHIRTHIHLRMSLHYQQPVDADTADVAFKPASRSKLHTLRPPILYSFTVPLPLRHLEVLEAIYLGVVGQYLSPFSGSLLETNGFSIMTAKNKTLHLHCYHIDYLIRTLEDLFFKKKNHLQDVPK